MIAWIHRNLPIVLAATLSLLLHALVLFPLIVVVLAPPSDGRATGVVLGTANQGLKGPTHDPERERTVEKRPELERTMRRKMEIRKLQRERQEPEEQPPEREEEKPDEEVVLGIDESTADTMNWIGYAEYERHLAALAEVEQAALRVQTSAGSQGTASPSLVPAPPSPTVAMSPDPIDPLLPPDAGSADPADTTLEATRSEQPSTPPAATARTEASETTGSDDERARPVPADPAASEGRSANDDQPLDDPNIRDEDAPAVEEGLDPDLPAPDDAGNETPWIPATLARPTDLQRIPDTLVRPDERPDPSAISPEQFLNPSAPGLLEFALPREGADADSLSPIPPTEVPNAERDPSVRKEVPDEPSRERERNPDDPETRGDRNASRGGGIAGPTATDGAAAPSATPSPAGAPGDTRDEQGALSTRESDASSTIDVPLADWRNGKPLARKGIMLQTFRPKLNTLDRIDGVRFNPIVELVVGSDGIPRHVVIARSSGNPGINEAIRSSLFKWRASGKRISELKPGQTLTIRLKLLMLQD